MEVGEEVKDASLLDVVVVTADADAEKVAVAVAVGLATDVNVEPADDCVDVVFVETVGDMVEEDCCLVEVGKSEEEAECEKEEVNSKPAQST